MPGCGAAGILDRDAALPAARLRIPAADRGAAAVFSPVLFL